MLGRGGQDMAGDEGAGWGLRPEGVDVSRPGLLQIPKPALPSPRLHFFKMQVPASVSSSVNQPLS